MKKQITLILLFLLFVGEFQLIGQTSKINNANSTNLTMLNPNEATFIGYNIYRNGIKINAEPIIELQFDDTTPDNGQYSYYVTALYEEGESKPSNLTEVLIDQNAGLQNYVVFEEGTGTWCKFCPGAAMGLEDLISNGKQVLGIAYHNGDDFVNEASTSRNNFYGISGFPTAVFDGIEKFEGGSTYSSLYSSYLPIYNERIQVTRPFIMGAMGTVDGASYSFSVGVEKVGLVESTNLKVITAIVEDDIDIVWEGQTKVNAVERLMLPDASGTSVFFNSENKQNISLNFTSDSAWNVDNCTMIAFIQDFDTKEILGATKLKLSDFKTTSPLKKVTFLSTLLSPYRFAVDYSMVSTAVHLTWNGAGSSDWFEWDNGTNSSSFGSTLSVRDFDVAARWEPGDIKPLEGMAISKVAFFPSEPTCNYSLRVWKGEDASTIVIDSLLSSIEAGAWNEIILNTPIAIDIENELWIGYYNDNTQKKYSAGYDAGPAKVDKGDKVRFYTNGLPGTWINIEYGPYSKNVNWNIKFYIEPFKAPQDTTAVTELKQPKFELYPNPASHAVTIESERLIQTLYLISVNGQVVYRSYRVGKSTQVNLEALKAGIYFVKIETDRGYNFKKLVVE